MVFGNNADLQKVQNGKERKMNRKKLFVTVGVCTAMISVGAGSAAAAYVAGSGAKSYPVSAKVDALLENLHGKYVYQGEDGTEYVHGDFDAIRNLKLLIPLNGLP